ncbi:MAG: CobD/CbiB family protein, partial [Pseudomonadota bacterium]
MGIIAIIAALVLEQWRPLGDRKAVAAALAAWADWLERTFNAGESRHGTIAWLIGALAPTAAALALYALLAWLTPFAALLLNIAALYLTLGFRQFSHFFTGIQSAVRDSDVD